MGTNGPPATSMFQCNVSVPLHGPLRDVSQHVVRITYASVSFFHTAGQGTRSIPLVAASRTDPLPLRFLPFQHWFGSDRPTAIACWILAGVAAVALILLIPVVELPAPLRQAAPVALHRFQLLLAFILAAVPI